MSYQNQQLLRQQIQSAYDMGFSADVIEYANSIAKPGDNFIEICLDIQAKQQTSQSSNMGPSPQLASKKTESYNDQIDYDQDYRVIDRIRKINLPVGLMNIGNTCYFNSLIQSYFKNCEFCKYILKYRYPSSMNFCKLSKYLGEQKSKRVIASINLVVHLQRLFSYMILSEKKFFNPIHVLKNIVNTYGERLKIGDQQDIGEFNLTFLSRVEEGLIYSENNVTKLEDKWLEAQVNNSQSQSTIDSKEEDQSAEEDKIIKSLFFGKRSQIRTFLEDEKEITHKETQEFQQIYLRLECKDLYTAWEEQRMYQVDDFKNDQNQTVSALIQFWISTIPKVLLFQINRMSYDSKTKEVFKLHAEFHFDKEIYVDRFLEANKEIFFKIQEQQLQLKKQKDEVNKQLEYYRNFKDSQFGIEQLLSMVIEYYKDQSDPQKQLTNPIDHSNIIKHLSEGKDNCKQAIEKLEQELMQIQQQEDELFQSMKKKKYTLQSILVHKGSQAEFGHYFSYIFDFQQQKWFKYDDINCTEVEEQEVMKNSRGFGDQSAYGLIYVDEDLKEKNKETIYKQDSSNIVQYLPVNLKEEIIKENKQFQIDLEEYNMQQQVTIIMKEYDKRFTLVENYFSRLSRQGSIDKRNPCLLNFGGFLYQQSLLSLFQHHILDISLKATINPTYTVSDLLSNTHLSIKLKEYSKKLYTNRQFNLSSMSKEKQQLEIKYDEYIQNIKCSTVATIIYEEANNQEWEKCLIGIHKLIKLNNPEQPYFRQIGNHILQLTLLKLSCNIFDFCGQDTPQNIFKIVTVIVAFSKLLPKNLEILLAQIKQNLKDFSKNAEVIFDKATFKNYKEFEKGLSENNKNEQYAPIVQQPHPKIESKLEEISIKASFYCEWSTTINEDKYLNQLINQQKQLEQNFKVIINFYQYLYDKQQILTLKERVNSKLHRDLITK